MMDINAEIQKLVEEMREVGRRPALAAGAGPAGTGTRRGTCNRLAYDGTERKDEQR